LSVEELFKPVRYVQKIKLAMVVTSISMITMSAGPLGFPVISLRGPEIISYATKHYAPEVFPEEKSGEIGKIIATYMLY
jgi:hypothetical protein